MKSKQRFVKACRNEPVDRPPVWMMRQAGRTLKEYRDLRETYSFWDLCKSPDLAATVTLQPIKRFPLDAAVIFSDILVVPAAMGMDVAFSPKLKLRPKIQDFLDLKTLTAPDLPRSLGYVPEIIKEVRKRTEDEIAVLGFSGAPFTLACYMVEGGSSQTFALVRVMMYQHPKLFHGLMEFVSDVVADYLLMQAEAGPTAVQIFDTWAGELSPVEFEEFVLPYVAKIVEKVKSANLILIYYINGIGNLVELADQCGADVLGVDWRISMESVLKRIPQNRPVQGNIDPALLYSEPEKITQAVKQLINKTKGQRHIMNLGHGLLPTTPIEGIQTFVDSVVNWDKQNG